MGVKSLDHWRKIFWGREVGLQKLDLCKLDPPSTGRKDFSGEGTESSARQVVHRCSKE